MNEQDFVCQCPLNEEGIKDYFENGIHNHPSLVNQQVHIVEDHGIAQYGIGFQPPLDHQEGDECGFFMGQIDWVIDSFAEKILECAIENGSATTGNVDVQKNNQQGDIAVRIYIS